MQIMNSSKTGIITLADKEFEDNRANMLLQKVKSNPLEKKKVPYRVNPKTVILVSPTKYKSLNKKL